MSAKTGENVFEAFEAICDQAIQNERNKDDICCVEVKGSMLSQFDADRDKPSFLLGPDENDRDESTVYGGVSSSLPDTSQIQTR